MKLYTKDEQDLERERLGALLFCFFMHIPVSERNITSTQEAKRAGEFETLKCGQG